jgi:hypothetical protein
MASVAPQEALQALILRTVDANGSIPDTRLLDSNGSKLASVEDQMAVKAVLDSLGSKEVR